MFVKLPDSQMLVDLDRVVSVTPSSSGYMVRYDVGSVVVPDIREHYVRSVDYDYIAERLLS